jgi:hypothetical protein
MAIGSLPLSTIDFTMITTSSIMLSAGEISTQIDDDGTCSPCPLTI